MDEAEWKKVGRSRANWRAGVYTTLVFLSGPPAALVTWWLRTKINGNRKKRWLLASCSMFLLSILWPLRDIVPLWLAPWAGGFVLSGWGPLVVDWSEIGINKMRYKTSEDRQREWQQDLDRRQFVATQDMKDLPPLSLVDDYLQFGRLMDSTGDFSPGLGMKNLHGALGMKLDQLFQHVAIYGTTGAGKSWLMKWIVYQILFLTDWDLFVVDCKGSLNLASEIHNMMAYRRQQQVPLFMLGHEGKVGTAYDGFRGSGRGIYNRISAMCGLQLMDEQADTSWYAANQRLALSMACEAPGGIPKDLTEVFYRVRNKNALKGLYRPELKYQKAHDKIDAIRDEAIDGLGLKIAGWEDRYENIMGPGGFDLEDEPHAAYFCLNTLGGEDDVVRFLFSFVENLKHYIGNPLRQAGRRGVLLVDEFGGVGGRNIERVLQQAREAGIAVILSAQDLAFLDKDENQRRRIMSVIGTDIDMRTKFPDDLLKIAGEQEQTDTSYQFRAGEATGDGSIRMKQGFVIPRDKLIGADDGVGFVVRRNHAWQIHVPRTPTVPTFPNALMRKPVTPYVHPKTKPGGGNPSSPVVHREAKGKNT